VDFDVVIVGAGPYGLSAAAHLKAAGMAVRVFGEPMDFWANRMPDGMLLRSPREASNIAGPQAEFTLAAYEAFARKNPIAPLPRETFVDYGCWFGSKLGSIVERTRVESVRREESVFRITLESGASVASHRVVVAAGIGPFQRKPDVFRRLPGELASHCYEGRKISDLAGKRVAVIGAGQSALESAALLHEAGSVVDVIAKIPKLRWIGMHPWLHSLGPISSMMYAKHDVGPAGISRLVAAPRVVSRLPLGMRDKLRKRAVRPAGSKWLPARLASVTISTGRSVVAAEAVQDEVHLILDDGTERRVQHVLLGTGYDVDISRYRFLPPELLANVHLLGGYPNLKGGFLSSVPGLHFVGATAARNFGPLLYFVAGTEFSSKALASHICRNLKTANGRAA
jgi:Pyridine nucleotide-disulphide oxidoreductase